MAVALCRDNSCPLVLINQQERGIQVWVCSPKPGSLRQEESTAIRGSRWSRILTTAVKNGLGFLFGILCSWLLSIQGPLYFPLSPKRQALIKVTISEVRKPTLWPQKPEKSETLSPDFWNKTAHTEQGQNAVGFLSSDAETENLSKGSRCSTSKPVSWSRFKDWARWHKMTSNSHAIMRIQPCGAMWQLYMELPSMTCFLKFVSSFTLLEIRIENN